MQQFITLGIKKILLVQTAFIGDAILASALLEELHLRHPGAQIDFMVRKGNESLYVGHPFLNRVLVWDKKKNKYRNLFQLLAGIRGKKYDLLINTQRFGATGLLTVLSGAKETVGFDKNPFSFLFSRKVKHEYGIHEVQRNLKLLGDSAFVGRGRPKLYPSLLHYEKVKIFQGQPYITIAPASVWFTKQFPAEKWVEFLNGIDRNIQVYFIGAPSDSALSQQIIQTVNNPLVRMENLCGKLALLETAALMQQASMNYTNDSGPMHIASAMNAPVRAVYCSTVAEFGFGPLSDNSAIIETPLDLECRPCGIHGRKACPLGHFNCAHSIRFNLEMNL